MHKSMQPAESVLQDPANLYDPWKASQLNLTPGSTLRLHGLSPAYLHYITTAYYLYAPANFRHLCGLHPQALTLLPLLSGFYSILLCGSLLTINGWSTTRKRGGGAAEYTRDPARPQSNLGPRDPSPSVLKHTPSRRGQRLATA
jgi:hypothetical protein